MASPSAPSGAMPMNETPTHPATQVVYGDGSSMEDTQEHASFYEPDDSDSHEAASDASDLPDADSVEEEEDAVDREEEQRKRDEELQRFQEELRKQIMEIQQDTAATQADKSKKIQVGWGS